MAQELKFKTSLNCGNCVAKVKSNLDKLVGENKWSVDTNNPDKILTVQSESISEAQVIEAVEAVGFDIEKL